MELKGTKTEANLKTAFAGESQAHTKYLYYAGKARKDGYVQIANLFAPRTRRNMPRSGSSTCMAARSLRRK